MAHITPPSSPCALKDASPLTGKRRTRVTRGTSRRSSHRGQSSALSSDDYYHHRDASTELTTTSLSRRFRPPSLPPPRSAPASPPPNPAILVPFRTYNHTNCQDVLLTFVKDSSTSQPSTSTNQHVSYPSINESPPPAFPNTPSNHALAVKSSSPLDHPIYHTHNELRTAFKLPPVLPRPPQIVSSRSSQSAVEPIDFKNLSNNYLNMLAHPSESPEVVDAHHEAVGSAETLEAVLRAVGASTASPFTSPVFSEEYLTSPFDDTPYDDFLSTPIFGSADDSDMMTSPLIGGDESLFGDAPLFSDVPTIDFGAPPKLPEFAAPAFPSALPPSMYVLPSPPTSTLGTPSPASHAQPLPPTSSPPSSTRRRSSATGTRKNLTPDALLPVDAPIQKRTYVTPSVTSRKEMPALFKKRARAQAFGDDDDEELGELRPDATQKEQIEWKRRQNTIAARKSRKRKLAYQQELETKISDLTSDRDVWKARALTLQSMLQQNGVEAPVFAD